LIENTFLIGLLFLVSRLVKTILLKPVTTNYTKIAYAIIIPFGCNGNHERLNAILLVNGMALFCHRGIGREPALL